MSIALGLNKVHHAGSYTENVTQMVRHKYQRWHQSVNNFELRPAYTMQYCAQHLARCPTRCNVAE